MGSIINVIEAVKDRIESEIEVGGRLPDVKRVSVMDRFDPRLLSNLPVINLSITNILRASKMTHNQSEDVISIDVTIIGAKLDCKSTYNAFYSDSGGIYNLIERVIDVIETDPEGVVNLDFNGSVRNGRSISVSILDSDEKTVTATISLQLKSTLSYRITGG